MVLHHIVIQRMINSSPSLSETVSTPISASKHTRSSASTSQAKKLKKPWFVPKLRANPIDYIPPDAHDIGKRTNEGCGASCSPAACFRTGNLAYIRAVLYELFEDPGSCVLAKIISVIIMGSVVLSILVFLTQTIPEVYANVPLFIWYAIELGFTIVFTFEYVIRLWVCNVYGTQSRIRFACRFMSIVDFLAVLPFYLEMVVLLSSNNENTYIVRVLRALRLARLLRIIKLTRYSAGMRFMCEALAGSRSALMALLLFVGIATVLWASAIYATELLSCPDLLHVDFDVQHYLKRCETAARFGGLNPDGHGLCCTENNVPMNFPDIPSSFWWTIVTMTTVGYGDFVPSSWLGRLVGACCMLCGILVIALPVAVVGAKFQDLYDRHGHSNSDSRDAMDRLHTLNAQQAKLPGMSLVVDPLLSDRSSVGSGSSCRHGFGDVVKKVTSHCKDSTRLLRCLSGIQLDVKTKRNVELLVSLLNKKHQMDGIRNKLREEEQIQMAKARAYLLNAACTLRDIAAAESSPSLRAASKPPRVRNQRAPIDNDDLFLLKGSS